MQILIGTHYTIISLDESKMNTHNLFSFIKSQFPLHQINQNSILLNYSKENHFKHLFLIKWIYSIHKKVNRWDSANLREVLIDRVEKPIKIMTKKDIESKNTIYLDVLEKSRLRVRLEHKNYRLFWELHSRFQKSIRNVSYQNDFFEISIDNQETKRNIKNIVEAQRIGEIDVSIRYNPSELDPFLHYEARDDSLSNALKILSADPNEPIDSIKKRYKKLLVRYHPDNVYQEGMEKINEYTEIFKNLQVSFDIVRMHRY